MLLGLLVLLAGCGIPSTGVVDAGEPGVGVRQQVELYFVRDRDHALAMVARRPDKALDTAGALSLLFKGVTPMEAKVLGLTTLLPVGTYTVRSSGEGSGNGGNGAGDSGGSGTGSTGGTGGGTLTVDVGGAAGELSPLAVDQIVCTARSAARADPVYDGTPAGAGVEVEVTAGGVPQHGSPDQAAHCARPATPAPLTYPNGPFPERAATKR